MKCQDTSSLNLKLTLWQFYEINFNIKVSGKRNKNHCKCIEFETDRKQELSTKFTSYKQNFLRVVEERKEMWYFLGQVDNV